MVSSVLWWRALLQTAYRTGYLTRAALPRLAYMVERLCLHPEQVLIGGGFLSAKNYSELVERCFQVALQALDQNSIQGIKMSPWEGVLDLVTEQGGSLAVSDIWARSNEERAMLQQYAYEHKLHMIFVFRSDIEQLTASPSFEISQELIPLFSNKGATVEWLAEREGVTIYESHEVRGRIPLWAWPATREAIRCIMPTERLHEEEGVHGRSLRLLPGAERLPWQHHADWRRFLERPQGICLVLGAPRATALQLKRLVLLHDAPHPSPQKTVRFAGSEAEFLRLWPHLLAGDPGLLVTPTFSSLAWDRLRWSRVPVLVIEHAYVSHNDAKAPEQSLLIHQLSL